MPKTVFLLLPLLSVVKACCFGCFRAVLIAGMSWWSFERSLNQSFGHLRPAVSRHVEAIRFYIIGYWHPRGFNRFAIGEPVHLDLAAPQLWVSHRIFTVQPKTSMCGSKSIENCFMKVFLANTKRASLGCWTWPALANTSSVNTTRELSLITRTPTLSSWKRNGFGIVRSQVWRCGQMLGIFPVPSQWMMWSCRWGWFLVVAKLDAWFICMHSCWIIREYKLFLPCFIVFFDRLTHDKLLVCSHKWVNTGSTDTNLHLNTYHKNHFTKKSGHHL